MKLARNQRLYVLVGILFLSITLAVVFYVVRFGSAYRSQVGSVENQPPIQDQTLVKARNVHKVTIKREGEDSCMEVSQDGVVRQFAQCGTQLVRADRLVETKNVVRLLKLVSERRWTTGKRPEGKVIELTIETDEGTETGYISVGDPGDKEITDTIGGITGDIPKPTPAPSVIPTPTLPPGVTPSPTPTLPPGVTPSPTLAPDETPADRSFVCGYQDKGKPTNVSNTMCSTGPTPLP
jgi:hypothetical protein